MIEIGAMRLRLLFRFRKGFTDCSVLGATNRHYLECHAFLVILPGSNIFRSVVGVRKRISTSSASSGASSRIMLKQRKLK